MKNIIPLFAALILGFASFAQKPVTKVSGQVTDGDQKVIESATITLLKAKDSSVVKMSAAGKGGVFMFEGINEGKYLVSISAVGHKKAFSDVFEINSANNAISLKTISLLPVSKDLAAVTVTGKRPLIEQKIDRTIVNVEASITNVGANALEVLEKSPGIQVDKDGNISLKGKDGITVLVDGRPTNLSALDLANMLRNMQANQLDQIEIMTNPPARYDAAGNAGIINIKTKKNKLFGYNGSFSLGYGQGKHPRFDDGLNFNYRQNKVNLFTNLSHGYNNNTSGLSIQRRFIKADTKELVSDFNQQATMDRESQSYNAKAGLDYFVNKKTTLGLVLNGALNPRNQESNNITNISNPQMVPVSQTRAFSGNKQKWENYGANFNYRHVFDTTGKELTADADYVSYYSRNDQVLINTYFNPAGNATDKPDSLFASLPQRIKIYSVKADYLQPFKNGGRFEAGIKSSFVETDNNANYDSVVNGQMVHDFNRSNHFIYRENINAAYVSLNEPLNKKWGAQVGLRLENTNSNGNQVTTGVTFNRPYTQLFPTAYLQYTHNKNNNFVLNYGRRIRRPNYQSLNPFINFIDRYTYQLGNPDLRPQFSHNIELSHTYKNFLTTTVNYSRTTDIIQMVIEQNEAKNETFVKQANIAKQRQWGAAVSVNNPITKWWKSSFYINAFNNKFDGIVNDTFITISATTLTLNGSEQFTFAKTWTAELSGFFRTGGIEGVIVTKPLGMLSFGLSKQIMKKQGTVRLNVRDIFYTQRFKGASKYGNVDAAFQESPDSRVINIGFTYRFAKGKMTGSAPKRRSGSSSDEQNRVGG